MFTKEFNYFKTRSNISLLKGHLPCHCYPLIQEKTKLPQGKILPHDARSALGPQVWLVLEPLHWQHCLRRFQVLEPDQRGEEKLPSQLSGGS